MDETKNNAQNFQSEPLYSKKDFDEYRAKLENEFREKEFQMKNNSENSSTNELEKVKSELEEFKRKYQEKENECEISKQKEETISLLNDAKLNPTALEIVYVPLDMEATKAKIAAFKEYIEDIKKQTLQSCMNTPIPQIAKETYNDPFIEGFETNKF